MTEIYESDKTQLKKYLAMTVTKSFRIFALMIGAAFVVTLGSMVASFESDQYRLLGAGIVFAAYFLMVIFMLGIYFLARHFQKKSFEELKLVFSEDRIDLVGKYSRAGVFYSDIKKIKNKGDFYLVKTGGGRGLMIVTDCFEDKAKIVTRLEAISEKAGTFEQCADRKRAGKIAAITVAAGLFVGLIFFVLELFMDD